MFEPFYPNVKDNVTSAKKNYLVKGLMLVAERGALGGGIPLFTE
jgi:hypothetical protein